MVVRLSSEKEGRVLPLRPEHWSSFAFLSNAVRIEQPKPTNRIREHGTPAPIDFGSCRQLSVAPGLSPRLKITVSAVQLRPWPLRLREVSRRRLGAFGPCVTRSVTTHPGNPLPLEGRETAGLMEPEAVIVVYPRRSRVVELAWRGPRRSALVPTRALRDQDHTDHHEQREHGGQRDIVDCQAALVDGLIKRVGDGSAERSRQDERRPKERRVGHVLRQFVLFVAGRVYHCHRQPLTVRRVFAAVSFAWPRQPGERWGRARANV